MFKLLQVHYNSRSINAANELSESNPLGFWIVFLLPFVLFIAYYIYMRVISTKNGNEEKIDPNLIILAGIIIKGDDKITEIELKKVKLFLEKNLSSKKSDNYYNLLKNSLKLELDLDEIISKTNYNVLVRGNNINSESKRNKVKWMHFLISIALADRLLTKNEFQILEKIRIGWELPLQTFNSILAMFNYYTEEDINRQKNVKQYTTKSIKRYYKVLELNENATDEEVKTAYRNLAKQYHPDKITNTKSDLQKIAKQKFILVQEAYEKIKISRRIK